MSDLSSFFILTLSLLTYDRNTDATRNSLNAYLKQSGYDRNIQNYVDKNTSIEVRSRFGDVLFITNVLLEKRIVYVQTF